MNGDLSYTDKTAEVLRDVARQRIPADGSSATCRSLPIPRSKAIGPADLTLDPLDCATILTLTRAFSPHFFAVKLRKLGPNRTHESI